MLALLSSLILLLMYWRVLGSWVRTGHLTWGPFEFDSLSALLASIASLVGFLCMLYSISYMGEEKSVGRYYFWMLTFVASMILLVTANEFLVLVAAWELTGLCSYALISFWTERENAASGSLKAILITEAGSSLLVAGLAVLSSVAGTHEVSGLIAAAEKGVLPANLLTVFACAAIAVAILSKSAQFPLHVWLPDAMAAPTPVSALLHAAAMVKAGVYLLARLWPVFNAVAWWWAPVFAAAGSITMVVGGLFMLAQNDIKRLLAYSTVTQLGYITASIGLGTVWGMAAALFHLLNHAVIKCLLFLSAGSVEHETGVRHLDEMGGLASKMPITAAGFVVGALSLAGMPPLNGFVSKWMIYAASLSAGGLGAVVGVAAFVSSAFTMAALLKASHSAFFGVRPPRLEEVREGPAPMTLPLVLLSVAVVLLGVSPYQALGLLVAPYAQVSVSEVLQIGVGSLAETSIVLLVIGGLVVGLAIYAVLGGFSGPSKGLGGDLFLCGEDIEAFEELHVPSSGFFVDVLRSNLREVYELLDLDRAYAEACLRLREELSFLADRRLRLVVVLVVLALTILSLAG